MMGYEWKWAAYEKNQPFFPLLTFGLGLLYSMKLKTMIKIFFLIQAKVTASLFYNHSYLSEECNLFYFSLPNEARSFFSLPFLH